MSDLNWTQVRRDAAEERRAMSCMHGMACPDTLCVERQARAECLATAAEALANLGPVLDELVAACDAPATDDGMAAIALRLVELRAAWTAARAKLVTT